jgi:hypothetical protein
LANGERDEESERKSSGEWDEHGRGDTGAKVNNHNSKFPIKNANEKGSKT